MSHDSCFENRIYDWCICMVCMSPSFTALCNHDKTELTLNGWRGSVDCLCLHHGGSIRQLYR